MSPLNDCPHDHVPVEELKATLREWREDYGTGVSCRCYHAILTLLILHLEGELAVKYNMQTDRKRAAHDLMSYFNLLTSDTFRHILPECQLELEFETTDAAAAVDKGLN